MSKYYVENYRYIYDLPYIERQELCDLLNQNNKWEELAGKKLKRIIKQILGLYKYLRHYKFSLTPLY